MKTLLLLVTLAALPVLFMVPYAEGHANPPAFSDIVENARVDSTSTDEKGGLALNVVCECGALFPDGTTTRTIHRVRGTWIVTEHCSFRTCTVPPISNAVLTPASGTVNYMGSLKVTCNAGHMLPSDDSASYVSFCLPDGSWSRTESCVALCGEVAVSNTLLTDDVLPETASGASVTVQCAAGHDVAGMVGQKQYTATCTDGLWDKILSCGFLDCIDIRQRMLSGGPHTVFPDGKTAINLWCMGSNAVIQRRVGDSSVDFDVDWDDYVAGFGSPHDPSRDFWMGLKDIHLMTSQRSYGMMIILSWPTRVYYTSFSIGDASTEYALQISGYDSGPSTAGDSLISHSGQKFTTRDRDNTENTSGNCTALHYGGWWFKDCQASNLNGKWGENVLGMGIIWESLSGPTQSLTGVQMVLRPPPTAPPS